MIFMPQSIFLFILPTVTQNGEGPPRGVSCMLGWRPGIPQRPLGTNQDAHHGTGLARKLNWNGKCASLKLASHTDIAVVDPDQL
ncbi:hypothetical protein BDV09DRAFT_39892 [Aspergillus tetrazonus]